MIDAIFDRSSRSAAVSGVYQYDTGQRMRLRGLPTPDELLERDELLSGEAVTVQAQFACEGDSQAEPRLAQWDEDICAWLVDIPDACLTRSENVRVYVEVYFGEDENGTRTKTMYEGTFRPISRPASFGTVTQEQLESWAAMEAEIDLALVSAETATQNAKARAMSADEAAKTANETAKTAQEAAQAAQDVLSCVVEAMSLTVRTEALGAGEAATAALEDGELMLGLPRGAKGEKGETGDTGPSDITLEFADGVLKVTLK